MKMRLFSHNWLIVCRNSFLALAALEGLIFLGGGVMILLFALHLMPADPAPGEKLEYGPWHADLSGVFFALGYAALGLPGALGILAVLNENMPRRGEFIVASGIGVALVGCSFAGILITGVDIA